MVLTAIINNKGDIGAVLKELGSSANLRAIAASIITAGVSHGLDAGVFQQAGLGNVDNTFQNFTQNLATNAIRGTITSTIRAAIEGGDIGDAVVSSLQSVGVNTVLSSVQTSIGNLTDGGGANNLPLANILAHSIAGGLAAEALGESFASGASAAFASAVAANAGLFEGLSAQQITSLSQLIGGTASFLISSGRDGGAVNQGASIAQSVALNNYLTHAQWQKFIKELEICGSNGDCKKIAQDNYYQLSLEQEHALASCGSDLSCQAPHLKELVKVRQNSQEIVTGLNAIGGVNVIDQRIWVVEGNAHGLLKGGTYYHEYQTWAADNCASGSGSSCYQDFMGTAKWQNLITGAKLAAASQVVIVTGGAAIKLAPAALASARACAGNPVCWNQLGIAAGELAAGDALGGGTLSMTVATGGKLVLQKGDEIIKLVDDVSGQVFRNADELTASGQMIFSGHNSSRFVLANSGDLVRVGSNNLPTSYTTSQLQHEFKHAGDFGITGNWNKVKGVAFEEAINNHINDPASKLIQGTYKGENVNHYFNSTTGINVFVKIDGKFWGGWKLSADQVNHITVHGNLR